MRKNANKTVEARRGSDRRGDPPAILAFVMSLLVICLGLVAYRGLIGFDPAAEQPQDLQGVEQFFFAPATSSPSLMFAATLWLLGRRWYPLKKTLTEPANLLLTITFFVPAFALCAWGHFVGAPALLVPSLSMMLLAAASLLGGTRGFRLMLLPAGFLLLMLPPPLAIVNQLTYPLQLATADVSAWILSGIGLPVVSQADQILYGGRVFLVIESCSGLRTGETMLMASFLYQDLFFRSRLQSVLVVLAAPLVGLVANQIRVITIVLNPYSEFAAVHTAQGLVMIVLAVLLLAGFDWILSRFLPASTVPRYPHARPGPAHLSLARSAMLVAVLGSLAAVTLFLEPWIAPRARETSLTKFPPKLENGWSAEALALDRRFLGSVVFSEWVHRRYSRGAESVELLIGSDRRLRGSTGVFSPKTALPGTGWEIVERGRTAIGEDGRQVEAFLVRSGSDKQLVFRWYRGVASPLVEAIRSLLVLDRSPMRRPGRAVVVRIATPLGLGSASRAEAESRLREFAPLVDRALDAILRPDRAT